jgi:hypothetical protein
LKRITANVAKSRCGKLLETYPERNTAVIVAKGASKKSIDTGV